MTWHALAQLCVHHCSLPADWKRYIQFQHFFSSLNFSSHTHSELTRLPWRRQWQQQPSLLPMLQLSSPTLITCFDWSIRCKSFFFLLLEAVCHSAFLHWLLCDFLSYMRFKKKRKNKIEKWARKIIYLPSYGRFIASVKVKSIWWGATKSDDDLSCRHKPHTVNKNTYFNVHVNEWLNSNVACKKKCGLIYDWGNKKDWYKWDFFEKQKWFL